MELREWLIILGLALVSLIVVDGVRRLQRQRRVPRLDQAVKDLPEAKLAELDDEAKEAEINWELPNGGARVVKPADYSGLETKPKLERQEHPGPSRVLSEFSRSFTNSTSKLKAKAAAVGSQASAQQAPTARTPDPSDAPTFKQEKREPHMTMADPTRSEVPAAERQQVGTPQPEAAPQPETHQAATQEATTTHEATTSLASDTEATAAEPASMPLSATPADDAPSVTASQAAKAEPEEPVLRAEPEDAAFAKHASDSPKRRQLRSETAGEHDDLDDDDVDEYRLVDFEGIGRSLKRRLIERRRKNARKKVEKAKRAEALAKQKAERKALEAEQRREAKQAADAEKARIAQEQAEAREAAAEQRETAQYSESGMAAQPDRDSAYNERYDADGYAVDEGDLRHAGDAEQSNVVRAHPTLEKALRHDVCGEHAKETLSNAEEMVVISVLSRDAEGFDGGKLLELMMACGLRYSSTMGVFNRFETESAESGLQFSMVNVLKPGTFPIQEMDEFVTPGITLLMPLPGAVDSSAAFEAMVETAMVVVRHMGGELKDENRSVMTAQTIEFARQRVHDFERRHRLQRHMQAR